MTTGGSVIALKYNGGVLMACDTLLSYGSLAKFPNIPRIKILGKFSAVCATGDYADFQVMTKEMESMVEQRTLYADVDDLSPQEIFCYLHRRIYHQRSKMEPCLCQFVFMGSRGGKSFLAGLDSVGTRWEDNCVATGYGAHIAIPLLRKAIETHPQGMTREEATEVLKTCLGVLFYRECRAINKFQIADATNDTVVISEPFEVPTTWDLEGFSFEKCAIIP
eukprot:gene4430-3229_t